MLQKMRTIIRAIILLVICYAGLSIMNVFSLKTLASLVDNGDEGIIVSDTSVISGIYNGNKYELFDASMTWPEAKTYCESLGGHLVTITTSDEQKFIEGIVNCGTKKQYWIGLSYTTGSMEWVTGEKYEYSNWETPREPNHTKRSDGQYEEYAQIYNVPNVLSTDPRYDAFRFTWNDIYFDNIFPGQEDFFSLNNVGFICEIENYNIEEYNIRFNGEIQDTFHLPIEHFITSHSSSAYDPALAHMLIALSCAAYDDYDIEWSLNNNGFTNVKLHNYSGEYQDHTVAFALGQKRLSNGKTLYAIILRGSYGDMALLHPWDRADDWKSDFTIKSTWASPGMHEGFLWAAESIYPIIQSYIGPVTSDKVFVVTGHSRGAAVGDIIEKWLIDEGAQGNVWGYNFACPDVERTYNATSSLSYSGIFNINNFADPVSRLPGSLGEVLQGYTQAWHDLDFTQKIPFWVKYGYSRWFYDGKFNTITINGDAHLKENYYDFLQYEPSIDSFFDRYTKPVDGVDVFWCFIHCPTDVDIIRKSDNSTVASIINNEAYYYDSQEDGFILFPYEDQKALLFDEVDKYYVKIRGTGEGTMSQELLRQDGSSYEIIKAYENIQVLPEKIMTVHFNQANKEDEDKVKVYVEEEDTPVAIVLTNGIEIPITASGECGDDLTWTLSADGNLTISGTGEMWNFSMPVYDPRDWTRNAEKAPWTENYATEIRNIIVEEGVTSIGDGAFAAIGPIFDGYMHKFESIQLPSSLLSIHDRSFAWSGCDEITIPDNVTTLEKELGIGEAFTYSSVKTIFIGSNVQKIPFKSFSYAKYLEEVSFKTDSCLTEIWPRAFEGCASLKKINFPDSLEIIDVFAFDSCYALEEINLPPTLSKIGQGAFQNCRTIKSVIIPEETNEIGYSAFANCSNLEYAVIKSSSDLCEVFENCTSLVQVEIEGNPVLIEGSTFSNCEQLRQINIPNSVTKLGSGAFANCISLEEIEIPENVETILTTLSVKGGMPTFYQCKNLKRIRVSENNPFFSAYDGCLYNKDLTELMVIAFGKNAIIIPETVTKQSVVYDNLTMYYSGNAPAIAEISFGGGLYPIPENVTVYYPSGDSTWSEIVQDTFDGRVHWKEWVPFELYPTTLVLPDNLVSIDSEAFAGLQQGVNVEIPPTVQSIENDAFKNSNIIIIAPSDSYAIQWAQEHGIPVIEK